MWADESFYMGLSFMLQTITVNSKHGIVTSAELTAAPKEREWAERARDLVANLEGDRYGSLEQVQEMAGMMTGEGGGKTQSLIDWLRREM